MTRLRWPEWWEWELELSPHLLKRMVDRDFTEVHLRGMLGKAYEYRPDIVEGRWAIETGTANSAGKSSLNPITKPSDL